MGDYPHRDLYSRPELYECMFSWDPSEAATYLDSLIKRYLEGAYLLLDIGCGTGRVAEGLSKLGYEVTCTDICPQMCQYSRRVRRLSSIASEGAAIPLRRESVKVAYSTLATLNHFIGCEGLLRHLGNIHATLIRGGAYIADAILSPIPPTGGCESWCVTYEGRRYEALWRVESVKDRFYLEAIELRRGRRVVFKSRALLYAPSLDEIRRLAELVGFERVEPLKPFSLDRLSRGGRSFIIFVKGE